MDPPSLDDNTADAERVKRTLSMEAGIKDVVIDYKALQRLPNMLRQSDWDITVTVLDSGEEMRVVRVEQGDTTASQSAIAIDIGTTTISAELIDLATGEVPGRGLRLQRPGGLRRGRHHPHHLRHQGDRPGQAAVGGGGHHLEPHQEPGGEVGHRVLQHHPHGHRRQHRHDPPAAGAQPQVHPGGALHPLGHRLPLDQGLRRRPAYRRRGLPVRRCPAWPATWGATSPRASSPRASSTPTS